MTRFYLKIITVTIVSMACMEQAMAQSLPLLVAERDAVMPGKMARNAACESNAAAMVLRDTLSLSSVNASVLYDRQSRPVMDQLGEGQRDFSLSADSYTRLGARSVVWGDASFTTGVTRDVRWADCIDYERLAPYVLGDGVGGDLSQREYKFSGGYATAPGKWSVGIHGSYRAEIASRDRDPRLRAVVSDLCVDAGVTRRLSRGYAAGLKAGCEIYRQNCDIDFYNPLNDINTYPLTGLGTCYRRFTGNSNEAAGYQADGGSVGLQLISTLEDGFNCYADYRFERLEQRLRDYNNLTLAHTARSSVSAMLSYTRKLSTVVRLSPRLELECDSRRGTENLFGSAIGSGYEVIGERDNYRQSFCRFAASLPVEFSHGASRLSVAPSLEASEISCKVIDVDRRICVTSLTPGVKMGYSGLLPGAMLLQGDLSGDYSITRAPTSRNTLLSQLSHITEPGLAQCVENNYEMLCADRLGLSAQCRVGKMIGQVLYSFKINYRYRHYATPATCHRLEVALSASF